MKNTIVLFSSIHYDFIFQRPQALVQKISERNINVYYFEAFFRNGSLNRSRFWYHHKHAIRSINDYLRVVRVYRYFNFLGIPFRFTKKQMHYFIGQWIKSLLKKINKESNIIAIFEGVTWWWDYVKDYPFYKVCYDFIDAPEVFGEHTNNEKNLQLFSDLIQRSDNIFVTAEKLEKYLFNYHKEERIIRVPNGVLIEKFKKLKFHPDLNQLKTKYEKIIGYIGVVYKWTDIDLLIYCVQKLPEYAFVFVGHYLKKITADLESFHNVFFLGTKPHDQIPDYIFSFDVCLNPFVLNNISESTNPIKIYEYFACGKPVVSTDIHELKPLRNLIYIGHDKANFLEKIKLASKENINNLSKKRKEFAQLNSWDHRVETILSVLN